MENFDIIKESCIDKISKILAKNNQVEYSDITKVIENTQKLAGSEMAEEIFGISVEPLSKLELNKLTKEMEMHFTVTAGEGILIVENDDERDSTWWTNKVKNQKSKDLYYWNRYRKYSERKLPADVVRTLDKDTDVVMDNIEDPEIESFSRYGMVVGHVQSGKTGNYSGLVCKAADAGYKFIVVIAGGINNLRNQTQSRLNQYFVGMEGAKDLDIKSIGGFDKSRQPISLTSTQSDFNKKDADKYSLNFDNISVPVLLVIKKNVTTLKNVLKWLNGNSKGKISKHAMLVIDDESDYASINYKDEEDPAKINEGIRKLLGKFDKSSYVAYTATPFANIFIDHQATSEKNGDDLFPKHFIYALEAPSNYMGAKRYFINNSEDLDEENNNLVIINDFKEQFPFVQKTGHFVKELPESLKEAIRLYLLNVAIRNLREGKGQHNSMLVHASRFTHVHKRIAFLVEEYLEEVSKEVEAFGCLKNGKDQSEIVNSIYEVFEKYLKNQEFDYNTVIKKLAEIVSTVFVREVHKDSKVSLEYREDIPTNVIAVGGTSLSRGYTLEGLSISYFTRNSQFYDTLMQMGRWFGYRNGYEDLCKVYIPQPIVNNFRQIITATEELMSSFEAMRRLNKTPEDFGLGVQFHPQTQLQITAKNKMKNTVNQVIRINLDGTMYERTEFSMEKGENEENLQNTVDFLKEILEEGKKENKIKVHSNQSILIENIRPKNLNKFFKEFHVLPTQHNITFEFIKKYFNENNTNLDIAIFSTKKDNEILIDEFPIGNAYRKLIFNGKYCTVNKGKISDANPEKILSENYKGMTSEKIRLEMKRPLLIFYFIKGKSIVDKNTGEEIEFDDSITYTSFGVSFPSTGNIEEKVISFKGNSVFQQSLNFEEEEFDDDFSDD